MATRQHMLALALALCGAAACAQTNDTAGAALFDKHCAACHQSDGEGIPGMAPPLAGTLAKVAETELGRVYLGQVLLSGMAGTIKTRGARFTGAMPAQSALSDQEMAAVASYVLSRFNGSSVALKAEGFAALRGKPLPPAEVRKLREQVLARIGGQ